MKRTYNRLEVGERLRQKRLLLGLTQDEVSEKIDRSPKYYADIERGSCGMSVETLMALCSTLNMSMDYIIMGKTQSETEELHHTEEVSAIMNVLDSTKERKRKYAMRMLKLFLAACDPDFTE